MRGSPVALRALAALVAVTLAGCAATPDAAPDDGAPSLDSLDLRATSTTGVVRGYVVDEAIRPLAGAVITLGDTADGHNREATTSDDGVFGFDGLPAGAHFVTVSLERYATIQQTVEVKAGISDPPPLKVVLMRSPQSTPYIDSYSIDMFASFKSPFLGLGSAFDEALGQGQSAFFQADVMPTATVAQMEISWKPSSALSQHASLVGSTRQEDGDSNVLVDYGIVEGASPLTVRSITTNVTADPVVATYFFLRIDPVAWNVESPTVPDIGGAALINQKFSGFAHVFHHFVPDPEWTFVRDGPYPLPDDGGR